MAGSIQLKLVFDTMGGQKTWTFKNIKSEASTADVKNLMDVMIANGSVYKYPPLAKVSAIQQITTTVQYDLS